MIHAPRGTTTFDKFTAIAGNRYLCKVSARVSRDQLYCVWGKKKEEKLHNAVLLSNLSEEFFDRSRETRLYVFLRLPYVIVEGVKANYIRENKEHAANFSRRRYTICHLSVARTIECKGDLSCERRFIPHLNLRRPRGPASRFF